MLNRRSALKLVATAAGGLLVEPMRPGVRRETPWPAGLEFVPEGMRAHYLYPGIDTHHTFRFGRYRKGAPGFGAVRVLNLDFGQRRASGTASWHDVTATQFT